MEFPKLTSPLERTLIVGLQQGRTPSWLVEEHLDELEALVETAHGTVLFRVIQKKPKPNPATFIGKGKAEEIGKLVREHHIHSVIFDDDLSPAQVKNLETLIPAKILDRSQLILDIFAQRARTKEAKIQVTLAQYQHLYPRLTRQWSHLSRQIGGIGVRGVGETQLETDRRIVRRTIQRLKQALASIEKIRQQQRRGRTALPKVSIVGYTNAGKTTLFNRLTASQERAEDRLFATLDPRIRKAYPEKGFPVLFIDTVGFIRKLPHHLVASFRSTLEEMVDSDIVLHLIDLSHPHWEQHQKVGEEVLKSLGVPSEKIILVGNKMDRAPGIIPPAEAFPISARTGQGIDELLDSLVQELERYFVEITRSFPKEQKEEISHFMRRGTVLKVIENPETLQITLRVRRDHGSS